MPDYQKLYTMLFNSITDALELLDHCEYNKAISVLVEAQQNTEDEYIDSTD